MRVSLVKVGGAGLSGAVVFQQRFLSDRGASYVYVDLGANSQQREHQVQMC